MQDSKNFILTIVLCSVILFSWQFFIVGPQVEEQRRQQAELDASIEATPPAQATSDQLVDTTTEDAVKLIAEPLARKEAIAQAERIAIETPHLKGSISLKGARLDDLTLTDYKDSQSEQADDVVLFAPSGSKEVYFTEFGWLTGQQGVALPNKNTIWYSEDNQLSPNSPITLSWDNNNGLKFFITISIDQQYLFSIKKRVENYGQQDVTIQPYALISRARDLSSQSFYILHEGMIGGLNGQLSEVTYENLVDDKNINFPSTLGWLGITDKYWLSTLIPSQQDSFTASFQYFVSRGQHRFQSDYLGASTIVGAGQSVTTEEHLFAGAKKLNLLEQYGEELGISLFDRSVDFGVLYFITKPLFKFLNYLNDLLGNFGLAILALTVIIKIFLFPLANKSYVSMHKMKLVHPQMLEIRERFSSDKIQMNKEIMELYKREKVNPASGCLPILLQLPIFFALYKVLFVTIEMRHAPFYGWISDLSAPDPTTIFNLFGLFNYSVPGFLMVGLWPIIMGITMYIQQKMNPTPADPVQANVMKFLPFIFVFLFATFPAGLVIYWAWNNILSIAQQWVITRKIPAPKSAAPKTDAKA